MGPAAKGNVERSRAMFEAVAAVLRVAQQNGEMHADAALSASIRERMVSETTLEGEANLLILPDLDAANIAFNLLKAVTRSVSIGPMLVGPSMPAHIVTPSVTTRGIVNMSTIAAVDALSLKPASSGAHG